MTGRDEKETVDAGAAPAWGESVTVDIEDGIAWISLNRPEKQNAINPGIVWEMNAVLDAMEEDDAVRVLVITGSGDAFSAGQDLKEYFRIPDAGPPLARERLYRANAAWQWRRMMYFPKPTIAMVNGWCFGGAFQVLIGCDLAVAADEAKFGLSEINWGIIPAGIVTKSVAEAMSQRDALYYIMTGETFDGKQAKDMGLVNISVPLSQLRERTKMLAETLKAKNPFVLRQAKTAYHNVKAMSWEAALDYLMSKSDATKFRDPERGDQAGMKQFLDEKSFRPGLETYRRED